MRVSLSRFAAVLALSTFIAQASPVASLIAGRILEACSCIVPCPCNFGQPPQRHPFCEYLAFFEFTEGEFDGVRLKGLRFAVASGRDQRTAIYLESEMSRPQRDAVTWIAGWILSFEGKTVTDISITRISLSLTRARLSGSVANGQASLIVTPLVGNDGKSEIKVSRPLLFGSFPVLYTRKAIAHKLHVASTGPAFDYYDTNGNDAVFEFLSGQVRSGECGLTPPSVHHSF